MADAVLRIRAKEDCRWDVLSLGEVMLRFDPGDQRIVQTRQFAVWEGGGEYNVARGLSRCFGQRAAIATALVDNPVGSLVESLMLQGGVDVSHVLWREDDGVGRTARNGIYFLERGFGVRGALGCMDRGHTAISQVQRDDFDWERIFGQEGVRWFHTGGIFCSLSETMPEVARAAMEAARKHGTVVSFDCNYRPSMWKARGGHEAAARVNRELLPLVDVLFGQEGDLTGYGDVASDQENFGTMAARVMAQAPGLQVLATTLRATHSANRNDWGACAFAQGRAYTAPMMNNLEILDRVGAGDAFAAGLIFGLLDGRDMEWALRCGVAHGALVMTTPGDNSFATRRDVEQLIAGADAGVRR